MAKPEKTECPVTRSEFMEKAPTLKVTINGKEFTAVPKKFSTGSIGWMLNEKLSVEIGEKHCMVQVGMNNIVVGSKDAKDE